MRTALGVSIAVLALMLGPVPTRAHHGPGGNATEDIEVTGTVEQRLRFVRPHASMALRADGQLWELTFGAYVTFSGLDEDTVPVGATVTIVGRPSLDPDRLELLVDRVVWNDRVFDLDPRGPR
jgi:hypothetical protein